MRLVLYLLRFQNRAVDGLYVVAVGDDTGDALVDKLKAELAELKVGPGSDNSNDMGPLVTGPHRDKVRSYIDKGVEEGAELVVDGRGLVVEGHEDGFYLGGTLFDRVSPEMTIWQDEIFGPVLSIIAYDDIDEAIRIANDTPYGLSGYLSCADLDEARRIAAQLRTGMVHINGAFLDSAAPFGGYKQSGNGREWGHHGMSEFLEMKSICGYEKRKK